VRRRRPPVTPEPATKRKAAKTSKAPEPTTRGRSRGPLLPVPPGLQPKLTAGGYVFPVYGPLVSFGDSYGAFRGDVAGNWHHGDDIFAPLGAPLLACADGTVFSVGWNDVGGNRLWLRDSQGNEFYYAHLSAFSPLAKQAPRERAGGRLRQQHRRCPGTPPHLHFEVHPAAPLHGLRRRGRPDLVPRAWQHLQDALPPERRGGCRRWSPTRPLRGDPAPGLGHLRGGGLGGSLQRNGAGRQRRGQLARSLGLRPSRTLACRRRAPGPG
jgi:murein DD-endopeptidase MepM/ murein hydrolase activator NlpD